MQVWCAHQCQGRQLGLLEHEGVLTKTRQSQVQQLMKAVEGSLRVRHISRLYRISDSHRQAIRLPACQHTDLREKGRLFSKPEDSNGAATDGDFRRRQGECHPISADPATHVSPLPQSSGQRLLRAKAGPQLRHPWWPGRREECQGL